MIKVDIIKNNEIISSANFTTQQLADAWIAQEAANNSWGKPDRWLSFTGEPEAGYTDTREVEASIETQNRTEYFYPCEYSINQTDIAAQVAQEQLNRESEEYLKSTDWYILREMDSGVLCPQEIKTARAAARASIVR